MANFQYPNRQTICPLPMLNMKDTCHMSSIICITDDTDSLTRANIYNMALRCKKKNNIRERLYSQHSNSLKSAFIEFYC